MREVRMHQTFGLDVHFHKEERLTNMSATESSETPPDIMNLVKRAHEQQNEMPTVSKTLEAHVYDAIRSMSMDAKQIQTLKDKCLQLLQEASASEEDLKNFSEHFPTTVHAVVALWEDAGIMSRKSVEMVLRQGNISRRASGGNESHAKGSLGELQMKLKKAKEAMNSTIRQIRNVGDPIRSNRKNSGMRTGDRVARSNVDVQKKYDSRMEHSDFVQEYMQLNAQHRELTGLNYAEWMSANGRMGELRDSFGRTEAQAEQAGKDLDQKYAAEKAEEERQEQLAASAMATVKEWNYSRDPQWSKRRARRKERAELNNLPPVSMGIAHGRNESKRIMEEGSVYYDTTGKDDLARRGKYFVDFDNPEGTSVSMSREDLQAHGNYAARLAAAHWMGIDPDTIERPGAAYEKLIRKNQARDYDYIVDQLFVQHSKDPAYADLRQAFTNRQKAYLQNPQKEMASAVDFMMFRTKLQAMEGYPSSTAQAQSDTDNTVADQLSAESGTLLEIVEAERAAAIQPFIRTAEQALIMIEREMQLPSHGITFECTHNPDKDNAFILTFRKGGDQKTIEIEGERRRFITQVRDKDGIPIGENGLLGREFIPDDIHSLLVTFLLDQFPLGEKEGRARTAETIDPLEGFLLFNEPLTEQTQPIRRYQIDPTAKLAIQFIDDHANSILMNLRTDPPTITNLPEQSIETLNEAGIALYYKKQGNSHEVILDLYNENIPLTVTRITDDGKQRIVRPQHPSVQRETPERVPAEGKNSPASKEKSESDVELESQPKVEDGKDEAEDIVA